MCQDTLEFRRPLLKISLRILQNLRLEALRPARSILKKAQSRQCGNSREIGGVGTVAAALRLRKRPYSSDDFYDRRDHEEQVGQDTNRHRTGPADCRKNNPTLPPAKAAGSNGLTNPLVASQTLTPTKAAANPINK